MKLQATIVISYRADSFGDAGDALDDVLRRARERDDVEIDSIQIGTPASTGPVSLPYVERPPAPPHRGAAPAAKRRSQLTALSVCATDESQVRLLGRDLGGMVLLGAGDDELKRRVWDRCLAALLAGLPAL
jgi:hypothetical protein